MGSKLFMLKNNLLKITTTEQQNSKAKVTQCLLFCNALHMIVVFKYQLESFLQHFDQLSNILLCSYGNIHLPRSYLILTQHPKVVPNQLRWKKCHRLWSGLFRLLWYCSSNFLKNGRNFEIQYSTYFVYF